MFSFFIKIAYRTFLRNKLNSVINILGFAIGLSSFILISLFVNYEFNWDTHNINHERIYLLNQVKNYSRQEQYLNQTPGALAKALLEQIPEVENALFFREVWGEVLSSSKDKTINEPLGIYADNSVFEMFTFNFIKGDPSTALSNPNSIVLSESLAKKHFGNTDIIGKVINTDNSTYNVSAVIEDMPLNSKFRANYFISLKVFNQNNNIDVYTDWERNNVRTFLQLKNSEDRTLVSQKAAEIINTNQTDEVQSSVFLERLSKLHLERGTKGEFYIMSIYAILGFLILIISCINFLNLSTVQFSTRMVEIGVKKVFGSSRYTLIKQFLSESIINSLIALVFAFGMAEFALPNFNIIIERSLVIDYFGNWEFVVFIVITTLASGFISGLYPSFYLSKYNPINALKRGKVNKTIGKRISIKKILLALQFIFSIICIVATVYIFKLAQYSKQIPEGYEKERLLIAPIRSSNNSVFKNITSIRNELKKENFVENVSISWTVPYRGHTIRYINWEGAQSDEKIRTMFNTIDNQFLPTYRIPIIKGRNFTDIAADSLACLVNEKFAKQAGWDNPIGKRIYDNKYTIVGVVKDFHNDHPINPIFPFALFMHDGSFENYKTISIKLNPGYTDNSVSNIKNKLYEFFPDNYFEIQYLEHMGDDVNSIFINVKKNMMYFTAISIFIALISLFAMVSFTIKEKVKEIGIRKILGASIATIYLYLSKEIIILLFIANIIAIPIGYLLIGAIPLGFNLNFDSVNMILVILSSFIVTLLSISYWILKIAHANPVDSLRYE